VCERFLLIVVVVIACGKKTNNIKNKDSDFRCCITKCTSVRVCVLACVPARNFVVVMSCGLVVVVVVRSLGEIEESETMRTTKYE